ncbi:hypothetical protein EB796_017883 [Bugula neritina]|uniref:heparosan-N-sulfate-glucuronate 5-epimerase n=1 Tax=Bugula neritina TaxID=10212 RepID=A0A7J7JDV9_BUGNE|nr:hypothetical protein EB796_017883 [Bugula neritina]
MKLLLQSCFLLILPDVVEVNDDNNLPHMYKEFDKNPEAFLKKKIPEFNQVDVGAAEKNRIREDRAGGTPKVSCVINGKKKISCLRTKAGEVYMPFKFIQDYFEVSGEFVNNSQGSGKDKNNKGTFYFEQSHTPLFPTATEYRVGGKFMYFGQYNVEGRTRVMLISGVHGVPVSNQWDKKGYIYPIQVAQYGLSHHAKLLDENGASDDSKWQVPSGSKILYLLSNVTREPVVYFNTLESRGVSEFPSLKIDEENVDSCVSFDVKFLSTSANVSIVLSAGDDSEYVLTYQSEGFYKKTGDDNMIYGIGPCREWCSLHRDVMVDMKKFVSDWNSVKHLITSIKHLEVRGEGYIDNVTISEHCHEGHFKAASDWMVRNQDNNGGWPVPVTRVITSQKLTLPPGWYSAMGQGQAISLLVRAYLKYKKPEYLAAAGRGLRIYQKLSTEHGVRARFLDKFNWYEEYPTTPPLFILNGFIYSLFGLYDLAQVSQGQTKVTAQQLYSDGMKSLKVMLPLYDSGKGTYYDLRHVTIPLIPPNRARGDYHAVHISQLQYLGLIDSDPYSTSQQHAGWGTQKVTGPPTTSQMFRF